MLKTNFRTEMMGNLMGKANTSHMSLTVCLFSQGNVGGTAGGKTKSEEGYLQ